MEHSSILATCGNHGIVSALLALDHGSFECAGGRPKDHLTEIRVEQTKIRSVGVADRWSALEVETVTRCTARRQTRRTKDRAGSP